MRKHLTADRYSRLWVNCILAELKCLLCDNEITLGNFVGFMKRGIQSLEWVNIPIINKGKGGFQALKTSEFEVKI